jgi:hypothetical protein
MTWVHDTWKFRYFGYPIVIPELPKINSSFASCYPKFPNKIHVSGISGSVISVSGYGFFAQPYYWLWWADPLSCRAIWLNQHTMLKTVQEVGFEPRNLLFCHSQFWLSVIMPSRVYDWWDRLRLWFVGLMAYWRSPQMIMAKLPMARFEPAPWWKKGKRH